MADLGFDANVRVGPKFLFVNTGGMDIDTARERLQEAGYLEGDDVASAEQVIQRSAKGEPQCNPQGWEAIAQATQAQDYAAAIENEAAQRAEASYNEYLQSIADTVEDAASGPTAEQVSQALDDVALDWLSAEDYTQADLDAAPWQANREDVKAKIAALTLWLEERGVDVMQITENVARAVGNNATQQEHHDRYLESLTAAQAATRARLEPDVTGSAGRGTQIDGSQGNAPSRNDTGRGDVGASYQKSNDQNGPARANQGVVGDSDAWLKALRDEALQIVQRGAFKKEGVTFGNRGR